MYALVYYFIINFLLLWAVSFDIIKQLYRG